MKIRKLLGVSLGIAGLALSLSMTSAKAGGLDDMGYKSSGWKYGSFGNFWDTRGHKNETHRLAHNENDFGIYVMPDPK